MSIDATPARTGRLHRHGARLAIGLATAAIAVTTVGATGASAATRVSTVPVRQAVSVNTAITAFPVNKGATEKSCKQWTNLLNSNLHALKDFKSMGANSEVNRLAGDIQNNIQDAEEAGCAVIT